MRHLAITGMETAFLICSITAGPATRAPPPSLRISAGTRSKAITAQAPASSEILACSAEVTSIITPPLSISAKPTLSFQLGSFSNTNILIHLLLRGDIFQSPHLLKGLLLHRIYH